MPLAFFLTTGDTSGMKTCLKCGQEKPLEDFPRNGDKYRAACKKCFADYMKSRYHADLEQSRATARERMRKQYAKDPEKFKARSQAHRKTKPQQHVEQAQRWAEANRERSNEIKQRWADSNPEAGRDRVRKRRSRRAVAFVAEVRFDDILIRDLGICGICARAITDNLVELDHILPLAAGGTHEPDNVQLAHRACNRRKHAKVNFTLAL